MALPGRPGDVAPLDPVDVLEVGPSSARKVLVLVPGYFIAANLMRAAAVSLVQTTPDLQVWIPDRREQVWAEGRVAAGLAGAPVDPHVLADARGSGLAAAMSDLRRVVWAASDHGRRRVFLGGHSWGATTSLLYAAWDFDGQAGYRDLSGLLLVDGGVHDSFAGEGDVFRITEHDALVGKQQIEAGDPFDAALSGLVGSTRSDAAGRFYQAVAKAALDHPIERSTLVAQLPTKLAPDFPVTNRALLGWMFDAGVPIPDLKVHLGRMSEAGPVRDWVADDPAEFNALAGAMAGDRPLGFEWYWPQRLTLDIRAADPFEETAATRALELKIVLAREIDTPLFVFQTGLTHGTVFTAADWVVAHSRIIDVVHAEDAAMTHLDPLFAPAARNAFIRSCSMFLRRR